MIIISHRGNLAGPDLARENSPSYIKEALDVGFHVEVDLRFCEVHDEEHPEVDILHLGHDAPEHIVQAGWIDDNSDRLILHLKTFDVLKSVAARHPEWTFICHSSDPYTVLWGPEGYLLWLHDLSLMPDKRTLVPLLSRDQLLHYENFAGIAGACTDYPREARSLWNGMMKAPEEYRAWADHVRGCLRCLPSGGYDNVCSVGAALREAWRAAEDARG